jgi:hypothetical protein
MEGIKEILNVYLTLIFLIFKNPPFARLIKIQNP